MAFPRVILSSAQLEYEAIVEYLAVDLASPTAAKRFMAEFSYQLDLVCDMPEIHALSRMPELAALGFRPMLANGYVALYRFDGEKVVVAHVFHQAQDYARLV